MTARTSSLWNLLLCEKGFLRTLVYLFIYLLWYSTRGTTDNILNVFKEMRNKRNSVINIHKDNNTLAQPTIQQPRNWTSHISSFERHIYSSSHTILCKLLNLAKTQTLSHDPYCPIWNVLGKRMTVEPPTDQSTWWHFWIYRCYINKFIYLSVCLIVRLS